MPFECRRKMTWGPGENPVQLYGGDEVPSPIKASLLQLGHVAKVDAVAGKRWCDQPEEAQGAWADCNGLNFLREQRRETVGGKTTESVEIVKVKRHPTQMFNEHSKLPERMADRPLEVETPDPVQPESLGAAGDEAEQAGELAPPLDVEGTGLLTDDVTPPPGGRVTASDLGLEKPGHGQGKKHRRGKRTRG